MVLAGVSGQVHFEVRLSFGRLELFKLVVEQMNIFLVILMMINFQS